MEDNVHEVVRLLIARMESHPEEFRGSNGPQDAYSPVEDRWWQAKELVREYGTDEENAVLRAAMRKLMLNTAHEWVMDELLNGEERRRKHQEDEDRYRMQQAQLVNNQYVNQQHQLKAYSNQLTGAATPTLATTQAIVTAQDNLIERLRKKGWV